jgi:PAS domain S-box-containing protein
MEESSTTGRQEVRKGRVVPYRSVDPAGPPQTHQGIEQSAGITDHEHAEKASGEAEKRFRELFERTPVAYQILDADGCLVDVNEAWLEKMGYLHEEVVGRWFGDFVIQGQRELFRERFPRFMTLGHVSGVKFEMLRKDGTTFIATFEGLIGRDEKGDFKQTHCVFVDITERERAEDALRESEAKFRSMFENMAAACCLDEVVYEDGKPVDYRIIDVNPSYEKITGISRSAAVGAMASKLYGTGEPPFLDVFSKVAETGHAASFEAYFVPIGKYLQITSSCPGKGRFSNTFSDVTEAKKAEQRLLEYQKRLRSLTSELALAEERERRRIAIGLHDGVQQSLAMTKFTLQSLGETADQATTTALGGICKRIDGIIDNVRELSFELSDSVLYEVGLKEAVEAYLMREIQHKCGIAHKLSAKGDFSRLTHDMRAVLFRNIRELLTNVVEHAHAQHVDVCLTSGERTVSITVSDDGIGSEPTKLGDAGEEHAHFGLFSVAEQLKSLGGELSICSAPGQGTRITMTVPLHG